MQQFIKDHQDFVLVGCALMLIGLLVGAFGWGMFDMSRSATEGLRAKGGSAEEVEVNTAGAEQVLINRGLVQ